MFLVYNGNMSGEEYPGCPEGYIREDYAECMSKITGLLSIHLRIAEDDNVDFYVSDDEAPALLRNAAESGKSPEDYLFDAFCQAP